jgi:hypothetical protein
MRDIVLFSCPSPIGGANTEAGDTAMLWRRMGLPVTLLPAAPLTADNPWPARLEAAGVKIMPISDRERLPPWLKNATVVDFAAERAVRLWDKMALAGCRFVHVPCMTFAFPHECDAFRHRPPTAVIFQSEFQRRQLTLQYTQWGVPEDRQVLIHGAFDPTPFPFRPRPHVPAQPFTVGRLARPHGSKWSRSLWPIMASARQQVALEGDCLGWVESMEKFSGAPPSWVRTRLPGSLPVPEYLAGLHAILAIGDTPENWSRVVLEAMASGTVIVADAHSGYREQITHEENGLLCASDGAASAAIIKLATDEPYRLAMAARARESLKTLADPDVIGRQWRNLFAEITASATEPARSLAHLPT